MAQLLAFLTMYRDDVTDVSDPGDWAAGRVVFEEKGCARCHRAEANVWETLGPGLRRYRGRFSAIFLAQAMWNHAPDRAPVMRARGTGWPKFAGREMADLIAYLYFVNYATVRVSPARGERLFAQTCATCHTIGIRGSRREGPDLRLVAELDDPVATNERARFGKAHLQVDQFFESVIRGNSTRCYAFQAMALVTGVLLAGSSGSYASLVTNGVLLAKLLLLLALTGLLSVVHFGLQPRIDRLLAEAQGDTIPPALFERIAPLRLARKRLASVCLFLVITAVILGLQVYARFPPGATVLFVALAGAFAWRV